MLLLRGLSKPDFAAWGLFLVITYFLEMGRSGLLQNGLMTFIAREKHAAPAIIGSELALNIGFSLLSNVFLWAAAGWMARTWQSPQLLSVLPVYYATNFALAALYHFNFVQQAYQEFRGIFWSTFWLRGALFFWTAWCFLTERPFLLPELAVSMLFGALAGGVASWWFARLHLPERMEWSPQWLSRFFGYGKYVLGTNLSAMFYKNIDKLTLGHLVGPAAFAIYDAAGKITQMVEAPSFSIAAAVFPQSAHEMAEKGREGVRALYERSVGAILAIVLPFLLFSLVFAEDIVLLFAGEGYADAAGVLRLTAFFGFFMPFAVQFGTVFDSTGRPDLNFAYTFFTALLNLALSYWMVDRFGLYGAVYATLTGYSISFVLMQGALYRHFGIRWWRALAFVPEAYRIGWNLIRGKWGR